MVPLALNREATEIERKLTGNSKAQVWRHLASYNHGVYSRVTKIPNPKLGMVKSACQFWLDSHVEASDHY